MKKKKNKQKKPDGKPAEEEMHKTQLKKGGERNA